MFQKTNNKPETPFMITGFRCLIINRLLLVFIIWQAFVVFKNPVKAIQGLKKLLLLRQKVFGNKRTTKMVKVGKKYYWATDFPGFPSKNLKLIMRNEFKRMNNNSIMLDDLQTVIWGITNRCSLTCKHCYEWNNIATTDKLTCAELKEILARLKANGVRHIQLSGGEPLLRFEDVISLIDAEAKNIDFWMLTSGFGLTVEKANRLKLAGLIGVNISLDHWDKDKHNEFRGNPKSFNWVISAIDNCRKAGLYVSLSLCATRDFVTEENLYKYAALARDKGVHIIRILEARKIGRFSEENVLLDKQQVEILETFVSEVNSKKIFSSYPIINFVGFHQRQLGCLGAGNRYLYIDSMGDFHACPFCQGSQGNALKVDVNQARQNLIKTGCHYLPLSKITVA